MKRILICLILIVNICMSKTISSSSNKHRRFDFYQNYRQAKILQEFPQMFNFYELREKLLDEIEKQEIRKKDQEDERRRKMFVKHLLRFHSGSSFLSDFHTRRF